MTSSLVFTNTAPTVPYRGAGRPEAVYIMERLVDQAAREMQIDPAELRRKNLIRRDAYPVRDPHRLDLRYRQLRRGNGQMPGRWPTGTAMPRAAPRARQPASTAAAASSTTSTTPASSTSAWKCASTRSGEVTIVAGTLSHGQGHETTYAQMVADWLGMPEDKIHLAQADTDEVAIGRGTYASRSMMVGGSALRAAADEVIERGKRFAAHFMEADAADIAFADGAFTIAGTDRSMPIGQVAQMSFIPVGLPSALGVGLQGAGAFSPDVPSFPNGCHICEVEIDPDTGAVAVDRYTVVDDFGTVINPLLAKGQIQGGIAQGAGQALLEDVVYDRDSGQILTGTLMDYGIPRADMLPAINHRFQPGPEHDQSARRQGCRRRRHRRQHADSDERDPRRAQRRSASPIFRCPRRPNASGAPSATTRARKDRLPADARVLWVGAAPGISGSR